MFFSIFFNLNAKNLYTIDEKILESMEQNYGKSAKERMLALVALLNKLDDKDTSQQLKAINDFFNQISFATDLEVWNQKDYWASREEFLEVDRGDCEDYVIAKYFSLKQLGYSDDTIFLTYVKAIKYRQSHMVLTYYKTKTAIPLVLDNIVKEILPATQRTDLLPLFNFNGAKIYMAKQRGLGRMIPQGKVNLTKWTNLILKIKKEHL
jgi:predicted transglutaminase-like cysteine proteinase